MWLWPSHTSPINTSLQWKKRWGEKKLRNLGNHKKEKNLNLKIFLLLPGRRSLFSSASLSNRRKPSSFAKPAITVPPIFLSSSSPSQQTGPISLSFSPTPRTIEGLSSPSLFFSTRRPAPSFSHRPVTQTPPLPQTLPFPATDLPSLTEPRLVFPHKTTSLPNSPLTQPFLWTEHNNSPLTLPSSPLLTTAHCGEDEEIRREAKGQ